MKNKQAFTLIELLVVVLIIGILAAVALPQYKLAVAKARMTQLITLANSVVQAQERYYLANGEYTNDWENLDIGLAGTLSNGNKTISQSAGWTMTLKLYKSDEQPNSVYVADSRLPGILLIFVYSKAENASWWNNSRRCYANKGNVQAIQLCKNVTHNTVCDHDSTWDIYCF